MSKKTARVSLAKSVFLTGALPLTAGACLLVSADPCFAKPNDHDRFLRDMKGYSGVFKGNGGRNNRFGPASVPGANGNIPGLPAGLTGRDYDLNLNSATNNIILGSKAFRNVDSVSIQTAAGNQTFKPGDIVSAAEFVAVHQMLKDNSQEITLDASGAATGGSFSLNEAAQSSRVGDVFIPQNVTAIDNITKRGLGFSGDLTNHGAIYGVAQNHKSGLIIADNILNTGTISTDLTNTSLANLHQDNVDLTLVAQHVLWNSGTISSSGNLTVASAYSAVSNANGATMSARNDVNIFVGNGNFTNNGIVNATNGNINIATSRLDLDLSVNAVGGTFNAVNGDINIRDASYDGSNSTTMEGGDYDSETLNINGGNGEIYTNVGDVTGELNTVGGIAHVYADTELLTLGKNCITGDPTYANAGGSIVINGALVAAEDITILAAGNITMSGNAYISTANATGTAATPSTDITLIAGVQVTNPGINDAGIPIPGAGIGAGNQAIVNFAVAGVGGLGGNIDLSQSTYTGFIIDSSSNLTGSGNGQADGGNVTLTASAFGGVGGLVLLPSGRNAIRTSSLYGNSGDVAIVAGGISTSTKTPAIRVATINTQADSVQGGGDGDVLIISAQPEATAGTTVTYDATGARVGAPDIETDPTLLTPLNGNIQLTGSVLAGGGDVSIISDSSVGGTGGIFQLGTGRVQGDIVTLLAGSGGIGGGSGKGARVLTEANQLRIMSAANVLINNLGSVQINQSGGGNPFFLSSAGNGFVFDLTTTPDGAGNGRITIDNNTTIGALAGLIFTINLQGSEVPGGQGGIRDGANSDLIATNINLLDGPDGLGIDDIGTGGNRINTNAQFLTANTAGSVFLENDGPVTLLDSSAGNLETFTLTTRPAGNNGTITLAGNIESAFGLIGDINLDSSENPGGVGGIIPGGGAITALSIDLSDTDGGSAPFTADGNAAIGTPLAPIEVNSTFLSANTQFGPSVNIVNTITTGMVLNASETRQNVGDSFQITSSSGIYVNGLVDTGSILTLISGGKGKSSGGYIIISNDLRTLNGGGAGGTVTLTASGSITRDGGGDRITADNIILTSTAGGAGTDLNPLIIESNLGVNINLTSNAVGYTNIYADDGSDITLLATTARNQLTLTTDGNLNIQPLITGATGIKFATTANGNINIAQSLGSSRVTQYIELDTNGTGDITAPTTVIFSAGNVSFSSDSGEIGAPATALNVSAGQFSANTGGNGSVDLFSIGTKKVAATLLNSSAGFDFRLTSAASLALTNISTIDGSIFVSTSGTLLSTMPNSVIQVGEPGNLAGGANPTIILQNISASSAKGKGGSGIFIGANSTIATFVNAVKAAPDVNGPGSIQIITTAIDPAQVLGVVPANVVVTPPVGGANTYFGTNGITALAPNNVMTNIGADITFSTGTRPATAITLGGNVTITADPPVTGSVPVQPQVMPAASVPISAPAIPRSPNHNVAKASMSPATQTGSASSILMNNAREVDNTPFTFNGFANLASMLSTSENALNMAAALTNAGWISETELSTGEIPAVIVGDELGIEQDNSVSADYEAAPQAVPQQFATQQNEGWTLSGGVSAGENTSKLRRGAILISAPKDTVINTAHGNIKIAAKSLALIMAHANGLSVYDIDDARKGAIEVTAGGNTMKLSPGQHVTITSTTKRSFDQVNPAQMIGYRGIQSRELSDGLKAFSAEFSIPHAIYAVKPLKHIVQSKHPESKKIAGHLLKTASVLLHVRGGGNFEQVFRARKTAYLH